MRVWGVGWGFFEEWGRLCPWEGLGVGFDVDSDDGGGKGWVDIVVVVVL